MRLYAFGPKLYVSPYPRPGTEEKLRDAGVTAVLSLCTKPPPEEVITNVPNVRCWEHLPIPDRRKGEPPLEELRTIVATALKLLQDGHTVLLHCIEGRNRSVLAASLVERSRNSWTGAEAYQHAVEVRPHCLNNAAFASWLRGLP